MWVSDRLSVKLQIPFEHTRTETHKRSPSSSGEYRTCRKSDIKFLFIWLAVVVGNRRIHTTQPFLIETTVCANRIGLVTTWTDLLPTVRAVLHYWCFTATNNNSSSIIYNGQQLPIETLKPILLLGYTPWYIWTRHALYMIFIHICRHSPFYFHRHLTHSQFQNLTRTHIYTHTFNRSSGCHTVPLKKELLLINQQIFINVQSSMPPFT